MNNKEWPEKILQKFDPAFKPRWIVYNDLLTETLNSENIWLDCGAGINCMISCFGDL